MGDGSSSDNDLLYDIRNGTPSEGRISGWPCLVPTRVSTFLYFKHRSLDHGFVRQKKGKASWVRDSKIRAFQSSDGVMVIRKFGNATVPMTVARSAQESGSPKNLMRTGNVDFGAYDIVKRSNWNELD